jgi:hypothetical protein
LSRILRAIQGDATLSAVSIRLTCFAAAGVLLFAACGADDDGACMPAGPVRVGAVGTIGAPLTDYADCFAGTMPPVSLDGERFATATETAGGTTLVFDDAQLSATVDGDCRLSITYTYDTMLSDNTPAVGTNSFSADPDPEAPGTWLLVPEGSTILEWDDGLDGATCGNAIDDVYIVVQAR